MNTLRLALCLALLSVEAVPAQEPAPGSGKAPPLAFASFTTDQLDQLLAPIALYPDALIALILPAATAPADIVLAARYLQDATNDLSQVENRAWDDSVKSLTHYPDIVRWMDDNLDWTKQVGEAFATQPADVMKALQRLRTRARAAGTLVDSPQQQVLYSGELIRVVPTQAEVIFVPYYDASLAYAENPAFSRPPSLTFGVGLPVGSWLAYDMDWAGRRIWVGDRHRAWRKPDWRNPIIPVHAPPNFVGQRPVRVWQPPAPPHRPGGENNLRPHHDVALPDSAPATPRHSFAGRGHNLNPLPVSPAPGQTVTAPPPGATPDSPRNFFRGFQTPPDAAKPAKKFPPPPDTAMGAVPPPHQNRGADWSRAPGNRAQSRFPPPANSGAAFVGPPAPPPTVPLPTVTIGAPQYPWSARGGEQSAVAPNLPAAAPAPPPAAPPPPAQNPIDDRHTRRGNGAALN